MKTEIQQLIQQAIKSAFGMDFDVEKIKVDYPPEGMGDFSTIVALLLAKEIGKSPMEVAEELRDKIALKDVGLEKVEVAQPGFLNLYLAEKAVQEVIAEINEKGSQFGNLEKKNEKIMIEYSQPNTHKEFHIGHLRNVFIGSTLVNVLKKAGSDVIAANYIGDTGTHIAKCPLSRTGGRLPFIP